MWENRTGRGSEEKNGSLTVAGWCGKIHEFSLLRLFIGSGCTESTCRVRGDVFSRESKLEGCTFRHIVYRYLGLFSYLWSL